MPISESELRPETRRQLGIKGTRRRSMSKDECRGAAIRVLAVVAHLTQRERARVLQLAAQLNKV